jgi:hypothetical protein
MTGNVLPFQLGARKAVVSEKTAEPAVVAPATEPYNFETDIAYCLSNLDRVWKAHLLGDEMTTYLFDVVGYSKTDSSLELRRPIVSAYTFEQFCDRLLTSVPMEWRAQPAFFGALFIEFHERQNFILAALSERKDDVTALSPEQIKIFLQLVVRAEL